MVNLPLTLLAVLSAALASLCAVSDGALLALDASPQLAPPLALLVQRREGTHRALAFVRVLAQLVSGAAMTGAVRLPSALPGERLLAGVAAALLLVGLSESVARSVGDHRGARVIQRLGRFIHSVERVAAPVVALGGLIERMLNAWLPRPPQLEEERETVAEQFVQVVAAEAEGGRDQEGLLNGVFALGTTEVHEIMVPRVDVVALDQEAPWAEVVSRVRSAEHSRIPVYATSIDNVVGILYAKDLLPAVLADEEPAGGWQGLPRAASFIPGAKTADAQLRAFQASRTHMAIVVDEFGGTAGIVTIEDVLEQIVGDIRDEHDVEAPLIEREAGGRYWVSARLTLDELSDLLDADFRHDDVSTVGGLVYEQLGRVPRAGEELLLNGFRLIVERVVRRRVERVYFERIDAPFADEDAS